MGSVFNFLPVMVNPPSRSGIVGVWGGGDVPGATNQENASRELGSRERDE